MSVSMNPAAPHHLPVFITAPGESDLFMNGAAIFLIAMALLVGSVYFRLHALPEHMAHRNASKIQFEVVAVLALLALFTHINLFWVAALLLALVPIPDFYGPLANMARSLAKMAGLAPEMSSSAANDSPVPSQAAGENSLAPGSDGPPGTSAQGPSHA